jgi:lipid-binding SYLF domain-containing protein
MNRFLRLTAFTFIALLGSQQAFADKYSETIQAFRNAEEAANFFNTAYGYAVFPTIGKGGIGVGGAHGKGRVYAQGRHVGNTSMTQLTVGLQLGGQAYSQMIFFQDQRAFEHFTSGNFEFSAQATAVAITAGVSAEANTGGGAGAGASGGQNDATTVHAGYRKGMAIFTIAKGGLMYEVTLGGQKFDYQPVTQ